MTRRQRTLIEMGYFKSGYVQDLEDMIERLKKEIEDLKNQLKAFKTHDEN